MTDIQKRSMTDVWGCMKINSPGMDKMPSADIKQLKKCLKIEDQSAASFAELSRKNRD